MIMLLQVDIWNVGIVVLEMANGGPPNRADRSKVIKFRLVHEFCCC